MAKIYPVELEQFNLGPIAGRVVVWPAITENDEPEPYKCIGFADKSVDINGSFGGGSFSIEGTNHPTAPVYSVLVDSASQDITGVAVDKVVQVMQTTYFIKPVRTGGSSMNVTVSMILYNHTR